MDLDKLKEQLSEGTFYYCCYGTLIKVPVKEVCTDKGLYTVKLEHDGFIDIFKDNLRKVKRPSNLIFDFKWCYLILDHDDEPFGYIGKIEE